MKAIVLTSTLCAAGLALALSCDAAAAAPIATTDGEVSGLTVEVAELKRSTAGVLTLKFAMVNNTGEALALSSTYAAETGNIDSGTVSGVHLLDVANKKKYLVVRDSDQKCVCSQVSNEIPNGGRAFLWAKFPAPPADVKSIGVVIPHFIPMDDVPITQ